MLFSTYEDWYKTLWSAIDTAKLQDMNRNLFNQIKNITYKEIKNYKTYDKLIELAKNMNLVLPLIDNLNCEDMKDRHWNDLSLVTGKSIN